MTHTVLLTGATGYLGSYAAIELLSRPDVRLAPLVRARDPGEAIARLWTAWQLHLDLDTFRALLPRVTPVLGDLHADGLGLSPRDRALLREQADSILHVAASLNRKSDKACLNTNLRGTLAVLVLARELADHRGLRRFSEVSTVAVAGHRAHEDVDEDHAIDWDRSDYDPYARTKKFCEHMVHQLLPDVPHTVFRPSTVMGDSRHPRTTQFDMVLATATLADLPVLPLDPAGRFDVVPANWVGRALATLHLHPSPAWHTWHLSAGRASPTIAAIAAAIHGHAGRRTRFAPALEPTAWRTARLLNRAPRGTSAAGIGALLKVFWPYITYDTVFLNDRAASVVGPPPSFVDYAGPFVAWARAQRFRFAPTPLPAGFA